MIFLVAAVVAQIGVEILFGRPRPGLVPFFTLIIMTYPLILLWRKKEDRSEKKHLGVKEISQAESRELPLCQLQLGPIVK